MCVSESETARTPARLSPNSSNKHGRRPLLPIESAETADRGSGSRERGRRDGGAAKPVLADILTGIIHGEGAKTGRKTEEQLRRMAEEGRRRQRSLL